MRRLGIAPQVERMGKATNDWFTTVTERFGVYDGATNPTVDEVPTNQWILFRNTTTGDVYIFYNDDGTLRQILLATTSSGVAAHASTHAAGGTDPIKLDDLAAPDDNIDLNASTTKHGLLPKLSGTATEFLTGNGTWAVPTGTATGDVVGPASSTDNALVRFDGITGKLVQDSSATLSDTGDLVVTTVTATSVTVDTVKTTPVLVANLPVQPVDAGTRAFVTDANATTFASIVAGGGANLVPVYSDGTDWRIG